MKISAQNIFRPKLSVGLKLFLLELNLDLDRVKNDILIHEQNKWFFDHSIYVRSDSLTKIENAILYLEDRNFFKHYGFELRSLARVIRRFFRTFSLGGMSTIDQQVIRISLRRREKSISRKIREIILAICLNMHLPKRILFDYYIHNSYLGYGIGGCEIAAKSIFNVNARDLNLNQAAFVAALFPLPFPREVLDLYKAHPNYPFSDPENIILLAEKIDSRWAKRIKFRMKHALNSYSFTPKSL